jgi:hypothetical protein
MKRDEFRNVCMIIALCAAVLLVPAHRSDAQSIVGGYAASQWGNWEWTPPDASVPGSGAWTIMKAEAFDNTATPTYVIKTASPTYASGYSPASPLIATLTGTAATPCTPFTATAQAQAKISQITLLTGAWNWNPGAASCAASGGPNPAGAPQTLSYAQITPKAGGGPGERAWAKVTMADPMTYTGVSAGQVFTASVTPGSLLQVPSAGSASVSGYFSAAPTGQLTDSTPPILSWSVSADSQDPGTVSVSVDENGIEDVAAEQALSASYSYDSVTGAYTSSGIPLSATYTVPNGATSVDLGSGGQDYASAIGAPAPGCVPVMLAGTLPGAAALMRRRLRRRM